MNQSAILKKKGSNPNKAQSPLKNLDFDMQYRSSAELANKFKIKREQLANECNATKKDQAPIPHKRKNTEDFIPEQGNSKLLGHKSVIKSSSREELSTSHMIAGKGQTKQRLFQSGESIQEKGIKLPMNNSRFQTSFKEGFSTFDWNNTSLDQFQKNQGIHINDKTKHDNHTIADVEFMHATIINEHNKGLDDLVDHEELGGDEWDVEEEIDIDYSTKEISKTKKVRGQRTCKDIHARNLEERKEVTFDKGQAVRPTSKIVSELSKFVGTIARNPRFISLMYTSWHASKFLIPIEGKKWVITGLRDAWRRHKKKIKENFFDKNSTLEDMLEKCPDAIPDNQFRQLIEYWKHPTVQRATKDNNEEPSKPEMFIATRTKTGKEIQADTQVAIFTMDANFIQQDELQSCQNYGETTDDAFRAVFGKEQPGRLKCYGRSVTTRCVGSNLASPVDASSTQAVRGTNIVHSLGSDHNLVLQKLSNVLPCIIGFPFFLVWLWNDSCWGKDLGSWFDIVVLCSDITILARIGLCIPKEFQLSSSVPELVDGVLNLPWSFGIAVEPFG
ncbi:hypothetical protein KY284_030273 [Solanum tuberosum]|nr:hypothetical protein KY284_030273 [Solanum tuberosum]